MKYRLTALAMLLAIASTLLIAPFSASAAPSAAPQAAPAQQVAGIPITGSATNALGQLVNFAGTFDITRFAVQNGQLVALGSLTGTLTNTVTGAVQNVTQAIALPVAASGTCQVLHLTLGPLDLNLLGNLLCAVAGLLDNGGPLQGIVGLLNNILRQL